MVAGHVSGGPASCEHDATTGRTVGGGAGISSSLAAPRGRSGPCPPLLTSAAAASPPPFFPFPFFFPIRQSGRGGPPRCAAVGRSPCGTRCYEYEQTRMRSR